MQCEDHYTRFAIICLFKSGKSTSQIFGLLSSFKHFVYFTIERYHCTGDVVDWVRSGCPCSVQTKMAVSSRINRNSTKTENCHSKDENQCTIGLLHIIS